MQLEIVVTASSPCRAEPVNTFPQPVTLAASPINFPAESISVDARPLALPVDPRRLRSRRLQGASAGYRWSLLPRRRRTFSGPWRRWMSRRLCPGQLHEAGMATAEYAIATLAAVGFAAALLAILRSSEVRNLLLGIVRQALSVN